MRIGKVKIRFSSLIVYSILMLLALSCVLPIIHVVAVSFSDSAAATANKVRFIPVGFNVEAYRYVLSNNNFFNAFTISVQRVVAGVFVNIFLVMITAYPLSLEKGKLKGRGLIIWFIFVPMLFSGGLIPTFLLIRDIGLLDNFWVLILPGALPVFSVIIMLNFFRTLPKSLHEAALIDGASHFTILFKIYFPLSMASIATLTLFSAVGHWNEWFSPLIYFFDSSKWPLQTFLSRLLVSIDYTRVSVHEIELLKRLSDRSFKASQIVFTTLPILFVYPFLQKHFVSGIVLGSVKE